ncbi:peptidase C50, separase [Tanacetum coccineum]
MQHPIDGGAWMKFDTKYPDFSKEPRNVRLGLAFDGFNPFGNLSQAYNMWLVILTTYNLPLWLCMKESSFILTLLIPGPKSPGKDIDVYLRPLIEDLKIHQRHIDNDQDPEVSTTTELFALANGPSWTPVLVNSYVVDGVRYVMHIHDERRTTQNNGICLPGPDGEMYYGQRQEIIEFKYLLFKVALFRVKWFDTSNKGRKVKKLVLRNNMIQIEYSHEAFKDDQYILDDPDIIHFDNSSDLPLSTSLNDLDNAALHIDGQSMVVDVPPDIIDIPNKDDDIIGEEDALPHDLVDFDVEDLINVDDDGVEKMSLADVARPHGGDGGGDDRPPSHIAKEIVEAKGPVSISFEQGDKQTLNPLGPHVAHWSNYIGEIIRSVPLYYPSWEKVLKERKAVIISEIRAAYGFLPLDRDLQRHQHALVKSLQYQQGFFQGQAFEGRPHHRDLRYGSDQVGEYMEDEINALARGGKLSRHIPSVGQVLPLWATSRPSTPSTRICLRSLSREVLAGVAGGDDEESGDDEDDDGGSTISGTGKEVKYMKTVPYSNAVGSLIYAMGVSNICLVYDGKGHGNGLIGYADSNYGGDLVKRRSLTCFIFTLFGCAISWKSTLQPTVALSTTEAEYMSMTEGIKECISLHVLVQSLGLKVEKSVLFYDSQSALSLARNSVFHEKTKHIDVRLNFIRDVLEEDRKETTKRGTEEPLAVGEIPSQGGDCVRQFPCRIKPINIIDVDTIPQYQKQQQNIDDVEFDGKRDKYMAKCATIGYKFLPLSFTSLGELEVDAVTLLKRIRKFSMAQDIGARATVHIASMSRQAVQQLRTLYAGNRRRICGGGKGVRKRTRVEREKGVHCLDSCLANLDNAIDSLEHDENDHGLIEKIVSLCDPNCDVGMLWQFKSHHSHLKSELIEDYFAENCNFSMEERGHSEEPERMVSNIAIKVTKSLKSRCRAAHFYYDQGERMLLMGKMTKALDHAREGCERRYHLLKENFELTLRDAKVYTFHMNHIVAARVWSISFEEFILAPNNSFICYLNSVHQEATILELIGDKLMAMSALEWGKGLSLQRGPSFYLRRFHAAISRIYRKAQDINEAKKELRQAEELPRCVSCKSCELLLKHEISKESAKQKRKFGTTWDITSAMQEFLSVEVLLKMQLNTKPSRKGHKNSKYGCRCVECTCRFSLLSLLKEKGKDYVFKDETSNARDVFLENICLVVSLSSLPSSESPMALSMLFELVKRTEIKVVHATHIAELIYIISWVACTKGKSDGDFSIPSETLIATLKHALILSSETPELFKKVAQLLGIMYLPGYFNEPPLSISINSLTQCHWACFFHELTVGSGVDYLFSLRLSKVYGDDCDQDDNLYRLTTSSDVDLNDFVSKFYTQLQPHTILVINILGDKYKKLLWKLPFYVPCEHVAFLMISRFSSTRIPLFYLFQVNSKGSGRPGELWKAPWGTDTIVDTILPDFKWIVKDFEDGISAGTLDGRISNIICLPLFPSPTTKRKPVIILVLDKDIQMLPWESMKELENQYIYRMPSVSSIFYTYQKCYKSQRKAVRDYASYATLDPFDAYYGTCHKPVVKEISEILKTRNLFIYVGHGDGSQHIPIDALAKLDKCASAILMGCYSGLLELEGPYIPKGAPIDYVLAGSPIVVGNLWVVRQTWALEFTKKLLKTFEGELEDEAGIVACLDLARKTYNNLMYRAGTICYGVPTLLQKRIP